MVIPVHDINPLRRTPWVTYALVVANLVVLLLSPGTLPHAAASRGLVSCQMAAFYDHFGAIPRELIRDHQLRNPIQVVS
ncbi:MAG TPA: hypothetical protein VGS19_30190, partial [Streptosporangiaceae bacterium]|nr:hypothetical protein [Streptosporangiaceae bacterium]